MRSAGRCSRGSISGRAAASPALTSRHHARCASAGGSARSPLARRQVARRTTLGELGELANGRRRSPPPSPRTCAGSRATRRRASPKRSTGVSTPRASGGRLRGTRRASRRSPQAGDRSERRCCAGPRRRGASPERRALGGRSRGSRWFAVDRRRQAEPRPGAGAERPRPRSGEGCEVVRRQLMRRGATSGARRGAGVIQQRRGVRVVVGSEGRFPLVPLR